MTCDLKYIDIGTLERDVKARIVENRIRAELTDAVKGFVSKEWPKRPDKRLVPKCLAYVQTTVPAAKVERVRFDKRESFRTTEYELEFYRGDNDPVRYTVRLLGTSTKPDLDYLTLGHNLWRPHADALEAKLPELTSKAKEWNLHLRALQELSKFAGDGGNTGIKGLNGVEYALYPLSNYFGWYELLRI